MLPPAVPATPVAVKASLASAQSLRLGRRELPPDPRHLGRLVDSYLHEAPDLLRRRLAEDGYLLLRGALPAATVQAARQIVVNHLAAEHRIDTARPWLHAHLPPPPGDPTGAYLGGVESVTHHPDFLACVEGPQLRGAVETILGEPAITPHYKWLRAVGPGDGTSPHYDVVFMGRGTRARLFTAWLPLGDTALDQGPLAILVGSHRAAYARVQETYGAADVDIDNIDSNFSHDPLEIVERYGGRWCTADFQAGDALLFGMFTMHASVGHQADRLRISCDVRFQPATEPVDPRWFGSAANGNYGWKKIGPVVPIEHSRAQWGV